MNRPRYNQRHPVASRSPASNHSTPVRITPNRSQWSSRPNPSPNRRQVAPSNINNPAQNQRPKIAIPQTAEAEFEQYFSGFFAVCCFSQAKTLIFFFILMICTQIMEDKLEAAIYTLLVLNSINGTICFLAAKMGAKMGRNISEQCGAFIKGLQCVAILVFLVSLGILTRSIDNKAANNTSAVIYIVLYALNIGNQFFLAHAIKFVNYIRQIKKCVLLMRVCVLLQLVVALIQANVNSPIPWFAAFFPLYILVLVILSSTVIMIRNAFFTHKNLFWKSDAKEKKKGLAWTLANLFALQIILLWGTLWASTVLDDNPSQKSRPYLALFIVIILWCIVSLALVKYVKQGVFKAFQALAMISDVEEDEINDTEEQNMIKYVIKVSNTYFKPATEQDIKQLKDQSASSPVTVSGEGEVEAALMRMNTEGGKCLVCCKNVSDGVFLGCGHGGICFRCGKEIVKTKKECHMCREKITGLLKVKINKKQAFYKVIQEVKNEEE